MRRRGAKPSKTPAKIEIVPDGLQIDNEEKFYKAVRTALTAALGAGLLTQTTRQVGKRQLVYIRQPTSPSIQGREGLLPALPLFSDERQSAWLVVEIESEYGDSLMLKHVSLKLWQGTTTDSAHLSFRAEWDVRDSDLNHAQPHWNVHAPRAAAYEMTQEIDFKKFAQDQQMEEAASFAAFEQAEAATITQPKQNAVPGYGLSIEQMHMFHFAMSSSWHLPTGTAGPSVRTTQDIVNWVSSCALYIKRQFAFVMGSQRPH